MATAKGKTKDPAAPKRKGGGSRQKNKGCGWERDICKILSEHMGGSFIRTPHSGAFVGRSNSKRLATLSKTQISASKSDVIPPDEYGSMNIEAKFYKDISFNLIMRGSCKQLDDWIRQLMFVAAPQSRDFLIFKINLQSSFIAFPESYLPHFSLDCYTVYPMKEGRWVITEFIPFLKGNTEAMKNLCTTPDNVRGS